MKKQKITIGIILTALGLLLSLFSQEFRYFVGLEDKNNVENESNIVITGNNNSPTSVSIIGEGAQINVGGSYNVGNTYNESKSTGYLCMYSTDKDFETIKVLIDNKYVGRINKSFLETEQIIYNKAGTLSVELLSGKHKLKVIKGEDCLVEHSFDIEKGQYSYLNLPSK